MFLVHFFYVKRSFSFAVLVCVLYTYRPATPTAVNAIASEAGVPARASLLQIATSVTVFVLDMVELSQPILAARTNEVLSAILTSAEVIKVGFDLQKHLTKLWLSTKMSCFKAVTPYVDGHELLYLHK